MYVGVWVCVGIDIGVCVCVGMDAGVCVCVSAHLRVCGVLYFGCVCRCGCRSECLGLGVCRHRYRCWGVGASRYKHGYMGVCQGVFGCSVGVGVCRCEYRCVGGYICNSVCVFVWARCLDRMI